MRQLLHRCARLAAGPLAAAVVGCGPGGCTTPAPSATSNPPGATAVEDGKEPISATADVRLGPAPVLTDEALRARVRAQQRVLGRQATLFEDESGRPIPWISSQDSELEEIPQLLDDELLAALPGSSGLGAAGQAERPQNGNALGMFVPVDGPPDGGAPLSAFHEALRKLAAGKDSDGKVRVLVYGASHTDADIYPHYLRTYLQERFGDGGHGFIHVAKPWKWYRHVDMDVDSSRRWLTEHVQRSEGRKDGFFGLLGASMTASKKGESSRVFHRDGSVASIYDIYYLFQPKGGSFRIRIDGKRVENVSTRAEVFAPGYHTIRVDEGPHEIEIEAVGNGEVRMFGMTAERQQPGVVVDTLGIGGTRASNHLGWDEAVWADNVQRRDPALYVLAYGTNEANDDDRRIDDYAADLRAVLERFQRAAPDASCLLVGPGDFPAQTADGGWIPRPRLTQIVEVQRATAGEMGCGFWNTLTFMGGELSMRMWVGARPQMAKADHTHFTRRGYVRMGMALTDALMVDFDAGHEVLARGQGGRALPQ